MRSILNVKNGLVSSIAALSLIIMSVPVTTSAATSTNPQPTRCSQNAPSRWSWHSTQVYSRSMPWCLHFISQASYLVWQSDGNFVWYENGGVQAKSDTQQSSGSRGNGNSLTLQNDGNIVVKDSSGRALWGLNYLNGPGRWQPGSSPAGDTFTIDLYQAYINSQTSYGTIDYYINRGNTQRYSATIQT